MLCRLHNSGVPSALCTVQAIASEGCLCLNISAGHVCCQRSPLDWCRQNRQNLLAYLLGLR